MKKVLFLKSILILRGKKYTLKHHDLNPFLTMDITKSIFLYVIFLVDKLPNRW